jgi:hypothetical protein
MEVVSLDSGTVLGERPLSAGIVWVVTVRLCQGKGGREGNRGSAIRICLHWVSQPLWLRK